MPPPPSVLHPPSPKTLFLHFDDDEDGPSSPPKRYATEPPMALNFTPHDHTTVRGFDTTHLPISEAQPGHASEFMKTSIPGSQDHDIAFYLGNDDKGIPVLHTADAEALKLASSFLHDKLTLTDSDPTGPPGLSEIRAIFCLPPDGKPIIRRVNKTDLLEYFNMRRVLQPTRSASSTSSASTTIKQESDLEHASEVPSSVDVAPCKKMFDQAVRKDAHITLLHLMHMQDPPKLQGTFDHTLKVAKLVADLAQDKIYDCFDVLRPRLAVSLHQHRQDFFHAIMDDPPRLAMLACALEDESMLTEAMIHMTGCFPEWPEAWTRKERLERRGECEGLLATIQHKALNLRAQRERLERELLLNTLTLGGSTEISIGSHPTAWLVTQMYRDAIASMLNGVQTDIGEDYHTPDPLRVGRVFRALSCGGDAYLSPRVVFAKFERLRVGFDHAEVLEDLQSLKDYASNAVKSICVNNLMLDAMALDIGHLTCALVSTDDMPWVIRSKASNVAEDSQAKLPTAMEVFA